MNYFLDTEFIEHGTTATLLALGLVAEDGREYYAQNRDCSLAKANAFVKAHVLPQLDEGSWKPIKTIRREVEEFIGDDYSPRFWANCSSYDWMVFCGTVFGGMTKHPPTFPYSAFDLVQYAYHLGFDRIPIAEPAEGMHNALVDARWNKEAYEWLRIQERRKRRGRKAQAAA